MTEPAKISIQRGSTSLSAEGSETFVREAIALWEVVNAHGAPERTMNEDESDTTIQVEPSAPAKTKASGGLLQYDHVFDTVGDQIKIISHVPGKSKAELTRNVAMLLLYGNYLGGVEHVQSEAIRSACIDQGCYDAGNFAQYLKGLKSSVVMNTKAGGQYDIKLTAPGRKAAKEFVEQLQVGA